MARQVMSLQDLIQACAEGGDPAAWEEFVRRFQALISSVVFRTARRWGADSPALVDDLVQESYLKLCRDHMRVLREFRPDHPEAFFGFLKVIAANVVHDHFRALRSKKRAADVLPLDPATTCGIDALKGIERAILLREIDAILDSLPGDDRGRDRTVFWLYYRQGLTAHAIAGLPTVSLTVKGVESIIRRLTRFVREQITDRPLGEAG